MHVRTWYSECELHVYRGQNSLIRRCVFFVSKPKWCMRRKLSWCGLLWKIVHTSNNQYTHARSLVSCLSPTSRLIWPSTTVKCILHTIFLHIIMDYYTTFTYNSQTHNFFHPSGAKMMEMMRHSRILPTKSPPNKRWPLGSMGQGLSEPLRPKSHYIILPEF